MEEDFLESFILQNEEVAEAISRCDRDLWRIQELRDIINEYMDSSLVHLDSLITLHRCCKRALESRCLIFLVLQQFEEEEAQAIASKSDDIDGQRYAKTLETLAKVVGAGNPFPEDVLMTFDKLRRRQVSMFNTLKDIYGRLNKEMKGKAIKAFRNVLSAITSATSMTMGVCADGIAEMAVPPVARVVEAGASSVIGLVKVPGWKVPDKWLGESINSLQVGQYLAIRDLDALEMLASRLKFKFNEIIRCVDFAARGELVKECIEEMRRWTEDIDVILNDLEEHTCLGMSQIARARGVLLQMVWEMVERN